MFDFRNRTALITGAAGNLGKAVAQGFARAGARLVLADLDEGKLQATADTLPPAAASLLLRADLTASASVDNMVERSIAHFGRLDILANVAGGFTMGPPLHETEDRDWDFMFNLNARSVFNCCRSVIPHMLTAGGGRIINVSARAAAEGKAKMAPYCASKSAVITLTQSLAAEHKFDDINVNCVLPGTIDTPQNRQAMPDADYSRWVAPDALADVIIFLASDAARAVNGAAVPVYGQS